MEDLQGLPVIHIRRVPLNDPVNAAIKRAVDIVGAIVGIVLFSPIMLIVALLIKLTSPDRSFSVRNGSDFTTARLRCISSVP